MIQFFSYEISEVCEKNSPVIHNKSSHYQITCLVCAAVSSQRLINSIVT